ncbi:MAG: TonB-dependent receptor, partial [Sphingobium sp.]
IVSQVPSLKLNQYNSASPVFNIRGVSQSSFDDHLEPPVAVYVDDAYIAAAGAQSVPSFDLARVEVLRGPQGTLFGRNATGGLIHFVSARPTKELEGYIDIMGGTNGHFNAEGAISGPLTENVQARVAGVYTYRSPFIKNAIGTGGQGLNNYAFRGQLQAQPTEDLNILLIGRYSRNDNEKQGTPYGLPAYPDPETGLGRFVPKDQDPWGEIYQTPICNGCDAYGWDGNNTDGYHVSADTAGRFNRKIWGAQGRIEWDLGGVQLTSISDYMKSNRTTHSDDDGSPNPIFDSRYYQRFRQFSEELRLSGDMTDFRWTTGFYYLNTKSYNGLHLGSYVDPVNYDYLSGYDGLFRTKSWSVFAQAEYDLTSQLTVIGGLRYVEDKKTANIHSVETVNGATTAELFFNPSNFPYARENFKDYAARIQLNYKITPDVLLYASFNRGIKGPNFIAPAFTSPVTHEFVPEDSPHKGETLLAYEAGIKASFLNNRVRLNLDGFIYDYKDYQAYSYQNLVSAIRNKKASAAGIEAELTVVPVEGLTLSGGISLMKSNVKDVVLPGNGVDPPPVIDTDLPQSPGISGNFAADYERPISDALKVKVHFDMNFTDDFSFSLLPSQIAHEPGYAEGNLRIGLSDIDDRWTVSAFVRNLWKEKYRTYTLDSSGYGSAANIYNEPRWFGLEMRYNIGR